jgi:ferritin-like metal-binding protein YciE
MDSRSILVRYLQDAEAAENTFIDALDSFSKSGDQRPVQDLMGMMSRKAQTQRDRLATRLRDYGAEPSTSKSWLAHSLAFTPTSAQFGHTDAEKSTQHLMITYAAAAAEMAMYESLAASADALGDAQTARLARDLQQEEEDDHELAWEHLEASARESFQRATLG